MDFKQAQFSTSAPNLDQCPDDSRGEVAFAGRSNAGKSSAINALCGQSGLARISKTPGRTQLINFFALTPDLTSGLTSGLTPGKYLVDLPGYGFAKVPLSVKERWQFELERYLRNRQALAGLVLLSDIRHPLKEFDRTMIDWATQAELPLHLLLTKADKLKRGAAQNTLLAVRKELATTPGVSVQLFSALKLQGVDETRKVLTGWLSAEDRG